MEKKNGVWIFIFLSPAILLFLLVYAASVFIMFGSSFADWRLMSDIKSAGFNNYIELFAKDGTFLKALTNTAIWVVLQSTVHIVIGVTVALILAKKEFYWKFARTAYMLPNIVSGAAMGMLYLCIFNPSFGLINEIVKLFGAGDFAHNWFYDYSTAFVTVTMTWLPFAAVVTILVLAEMTAISDSILEAARIDGAGEFETNIFIILPMLRNILGTCVIVAATSMLKNFDIIFMTTNGGPGTETLNLPLYLYKTAMIENNYGYANTIGTFTTILGIVIIITINKVFRMGRSDI
ncbi:MAG: sugar ABC transporter permease [Clostridiaceae bacterium]